MSYLGPNPYPLNIPPGANIPVTALDSATQTKVNNAVQRPGDTMSGDLGLQNCSLDFFTAAGAVQARFRGDPVNSIGFVNIANTAWNFYVTDAGNAVARGTFAAAGGTLTSTLSINSSSLHIRLNQANGTAGPVIQWAGGTTGITNAANTAWNYSTDDSGNTTIRGTLTVGSTLTNNGQLTQNGGVFLQVGAGAHGSGEISWLSSDGYRFYVRGRTGGGIEFVNAAYNAVVAAMADNGNLTIGSAAYQTDGNITNMGWASGQALSTVFSQKAASGGNCRLASGQNFGVVSSQGGALPLPYVVYGLTGPANGTANAITIYGAIVQAV
jgi:hypothetical protein